MRKSWSKVFLSILPLLFVAACGAPQPQQTLTLTPTEQATAVELVGEIAGKSFVGQWGTDFTVDVQINISPQFVFDPSGGGQTVEIVRDRGSGPYSYTAKVVSMRIQKGVLSLVAPGNDSMTFTISLWDTRGRITGSISAWNPNSGIWDASLKEGKL